MAQTLFSLGFATQNSPWSYQHTLGISTSDIQAWWKNNLPALKQELQNLPTGASTAKPLTPPPGYMTPTPQPQDNSSTVLLVSVLLVGGGLAAYYFYKKNKEKSAA